MRRFLVILIVLIANLASALTPINAITFGKEVTSASSAYPSVVSIWVREKSESTPQFICTGTLIESRVVLTAAHCVLDKSYLYYIKYGNDLLDQSTQLLEVASTWRDPRYSERQKVNDLGLLLLSEEIAGAQTSSLPTSQEIKKILTAKGTKLEVVGWGKDQNSDRASYIRRALVDDQSSKLKKYKNWRNDVWIGVGKYNSKEKVYAGSCNGDSGGPLFALSGSKRILVGVTSWGAEDCELGFPSIYVRLSYYISKLQSEGMKTLYENETKQNRALPSPLVEPTISGSASPDSTITCDQGAWSENTQEVSFSWSGPGVPYGTSTASIRLARVNTESKYICEVVAKNGNGSTTRRVSLTLAAAPQVLKDPSISGVPSSSEYTGGNIVTCTPAIFKGATSVQNSWWMSAGSSPQTNIGNGNTLQLTKELIGRYGGGYLYCQSTADGPGGITQANNSVYLPSWNKPTVKSGWPSVSSQSSASGSRVGDILNCSPVVWDKAVDSELYTIYVRTSGSENRILTNSSTYSLTSEVISNFANYEVYCSITGINTGGSYVATSSSGFTIRPGLQPNPVQGFTGTIGAKGTTLTWSAPTSNGATVTSYIVERTDNYEPGVNGESVWRVVSNSLATSVLVPELNPCHSSNYRVRAFTGYSYSGYSSTLAANNASRCTTVLGLVLTGVPVSVPNGFTLQINEFDNVNYDWKVLLPVSPQGRYAQVSASGLISDSSMTPGVSSRLYIFKISRSTGEYVGVTVATVVAGS